MATATEPEPGDDDARPLQDNGPADEAMDQVEWRPQPGVLGRAIAWSLLALLLAAFVMMIVAFLKS